jgi:translocation and assembly module TamB
VIWLIAKALLRGLLIVILVPLVLLVILGALLSSERFNARLFDRAMSFEPRLELSYSAGHLWRGWEFERIIWRDEGVEVRVDDLSLSWNPSCLSGRRLCIEYLDVANVRLSIQPTADDPPAERERIDLPDIRLPVGIQLDRLHLGALWLNDDEAPLLSDVLLVATVRDDRLVVHQFEGKGPELDWLVEGDIRLSGDWPLLVRARANLPPINDEPLALRLRLSHSVAELEVEARTEGFLDSRLEGRIDPLEPHLPLAVSWSSEPFLPLATLPETLTLENLVVNLHGDLEAGYRVQGGARLPGEEGRIDLALEALVNQVGLSRLTLSLAPAAEPERALELTGDASWADELAADLQLSMERFPWYWLYPQDIGELDLRRLTATASIRGTDYNAEIAAAISGVAGQDVELSMTVAGTPEAVNITPLSLRMPAGRATGEVLLGLVDGLSWDARLLLENIDPGVFVSDVPGSLNGEVASTGSLIGETLSLQADWQLGGQLRGQPLTLGGAVEKQDAAWAFTDLLLRQGDNRISGSGQWADQVAADLDIQMPRLQTLWPGLGGSLSGSLRASGDPQQPDVTFVLQGERIAYDELFLLGLQIDANVQLSEELPGEARLSARRMRTGETGLGNLQVRLTGNRADHRLQVDLEDGLVDLTAGVQGALLDDRWQGELSGGEIGAEEMFWRQAQAASLSYRLGDGSLRLGAHCWRHEGADLCFEGEQQLLPDRRVALTLSDFPLASLEGFMPEDFAWVGTLDAEIAFTQAAGREPLAQVQVSSLDGLLSVSNPDQALEFPYQRLQLNSELLADRAVNRFVLAGETLGSLAIEADVSDPAGAQTLTGNYRLDGFQLDFIRPFLPDVEVVRGELNGSGRLSGSLSDPQVQGVLALQGGYVSGPHLPVSFEELGVRVLIDGQTADIEGGWRSGRDGQGSLNGVVTWAPELDVYLALSGQRLPVVVAPFADLRVSPDLTVTLVDNQLVLRGEIAVPEGDIRIRDLPEQAVRVSSDAVIVGQEEGLDEAIPLDISARVTLVIGDQLRFSGFGLTGRLSGRIQVEENLNASGDLNVLDGQFRGYGQRLTLRRAQILFAGPISQPFLNIEAIRRVDEVVAGLRLTGRAEEPQSEVFSEPAMPQEQALSYLILGRPLGSGGGDGDALGQAALALGMAGSAPLARNIASTLGIEGFQLETEGTGIGTQVVAAGYLTERLSLRYGVGVFEPANQVALRYDLTRRLYLEAVSGFASSLDFFYRIDF